MAKIAHQNDRKDDTASQFRESGRAAAGAARAAAVAETNLLARATSGESSKADGTSILEILGDQTRHSLETATALGRARTLAEVAQVQSDFFSGSLGRMSRLSEHYLALLRGGMMALPSTSRH
jgi:hypothetical protein